MCQLSVGAGLFLDEHINTGSWGQLRKSDGSPPSKVCMDPNTRTSPPKVAVNATV